MKILSFDGSSESAFYASLDFDTDTGECTVLALGQSPVFASHRESYEWMTGMLLSHRPDQVVIECPMSFAGMRFKFPHLIAMAMVEGAMAAAVAPDRLLFVPSNGPGNRDYGGWRNYYFARGKPEGDWDTMVKNAIASGAIKDWPARSNGHVRDAALIGLSMALALHRGELERIGAMRSLYTSHKAVEKNSAAARKGERPKKVKKPSTCTARTRRRK